MAGRPVWARVAGGRRANDRVAGGRRAQVRVTFRPPPFPHPYFDDDATYSAHILETSYSDPQDLTTRTSANSKKIDGFEMRWGGSGDE
jgi:hypothetical protein